jgi:hypothetical protein
MKRTALWVIFAAGCVLALACVAGEIVSYRSRPVLIPMRSTSGPAWEVRLADGRVYVWRRPVVERRPDWSGQIHRFGFRYTCWSNGAWDLGVPLRGATWFGVAVGAAAAAVLWSRRRRASRGFSVSAATPGALQSESRVRE